MNKKIILWICSIILSLSIIYAVTDTSPYNYPGYYNALLKNETTYKYTGYWAASDFSHCADNSTANYCGFKTNASITYNFSSPRNITSVAFMLFTGAGTGNDKYRNGQYQVNCSPSGNGGDWISLLLNLSHDALNVYNLSVSGLMQQCKALRYVAQLCTDTTEGCVVNEVSAMFDEPFTIPPETFTITPSLMENYTGTLRNATAFTEFRLFFPAVNYTNQTSLKLNANCSFNATNITGVFLKNTNENITLQNAGNNVTLSFSENPASLLNDRYNFKVCKETALGSDLNVYINGVLRNTTPSGTIPSCSVNYLDVFSTLYDYSGTANFNITLNCSGCTPFRRLRIIYDNNISSSLTWYRKFNIHREPLAYDNSLGYYLHKNYPYSFIGVMNSTINYQCNNDNMTVFYNVKTANMSVKILFIQNFTFTDGIYIESADNVNISFGVFGDVYSSISTSMTYSNGTIIATGNSPFFSVDNSLISVNKIINISATAYDINDNSAKVFGYFFYNDTTMPIVIMNFPVEAATNDIMAGSSYLFNITASDLNLFGFNMTIYRPDGSIWSNNATIPITSATYNFLNNFMWNSSDINGIYTLDLYVSDSHTANNIRDYDIAESATKLIFNNRLAIESPNAIDTGAVKSADRYSFEFSYPKDVLTKEYIITSECPLYQISSKYKAHFVSFCGFNEDSNWIDFEGISSNPTIKKIGNNSYSVSFSNNADKMSFNSIGGLNIVHKTSLLNVMSPQYPYDITWTGTTWFNTKALDTSTTAGMMGIFFLFFIWAVILLFAFLLKLPILYILNAFYGITFGILLASGFSALLGFLFIFINIFLIIFGILLARE